MSSFLFYLRIIPILVCAVLSDPNKLTAVSNVRIAEILYRKMRDRERSIRPPTPLDPSTKDRICHHITGSSYFENSYDQHQVNMSQLGWNLRENVPSIFKILYERSSLPNKETEMEYEYTNRTKTADVYMSELDQQSVKENVFVCLTYENENEEDKFFTYMISEEYNLSDNTINSYHAGRFLFIFTTEYEDELDIFALAEEPAISLLTRGKAVELEYLRRRAHHKPAKIPSEDPICRLSRSERLRVCTLVLSSEYFESELRFTPEFEHVDRSSCTKRTVTFQDKEAISKAGRKIYKEWMIGCRPDEYYTEYQEEYYLSRVYDSENEVFVYRQAHDAKAIIVENIFGNVRFKI